MALISQILSVCGWNFRGMAGRMRSALVVVIGFFAVILVFTSVLSIRDGLTASAARPNADAVAVVSGARGALWADMLNTVNQMPGIAPGKNGPQTAGVVFTALLIRDWKPDMLGIAVILGIDRDKIGILPNFRLTDGRMFRPGMNEMLIGEGARRVFPEYDVGHTLEWHHRKWRIVGAYSTGSTVQDTQFITDLRQAQTATNIGNAYTWIYARMPSPDAYDAFRAALEKQSGAAVKVERLSEKDNNISEQFTDILTLADTVITVLMVIGAIFAALNVMYANVARRKGELAILRALGFARTPILTALLSEAMALALTGGILAVAVVTLSFDHIETSTLMGSRLVSFHFSVTRDAVVTALSLALIMGFIGGLFPAVRAARLPIAKTLREE